jgi:oxygen-independent coproporphyrinogen-3 oxidase
MLARAHKLWGLADHAEVSVEANPDSVTAEDLQALAAGGVTRVSLGVQSAHPDVLSVLDRTHDPARVPEVVQAAKDAGLQVSLDLIYGSPGEKLSMWEKTLEYALALAPDHLSAYALIVEPGTAMARRIARGELAMPDDDVHADMYELTDQLLGAAGYGWYEISNWATSEALESRHNRSYWSSEDWWGIGPGAHSHIGGVRWWNVKHPAAYTQRLVAGQSPIHSREVLSGESKDMERILLGIRMREGIPARWVSADKKVVVADAIARGLLDGAAAISGTLVVTAKGRLVADFLARELT